jgi:uncharacterized protein YjiS (DUF1127 family)
MNGGPTLVPHANPGLWSVKPATTAAAPRRRDNPAALRDMIAIWGRRMDFRGELTRLAKDCPELIDDLGLTMQDVEREAGKPFWRR